MQNNLVKQWTELTKKANTSLQKINELNTKSVKQLTQLQMEMVSSCLEGGVSRVKGVSEVKSVTELMNLQSDLYKELNEKVMQSAQKSVKLALETKEAMNALLQEGFDAMSVPQLPDLMQSTAKKAAPKKPAAKKAPAKKAPAKKAPAKEAQAKKPTMPAPTGRPSTEGDSKK